MVLDLWQGHVAQSFVAGGCLKGVRRRDLMSVDNEGHFASTQIARKLLALKLSELFLNS